MKDPYSIYGKILQLVTDNPGERQLFLSIILKSLPPH
jgi:hypothetical protein